MEPEWVKKVRADAAQAKKTQKVKQEYSFLKQAPSEKKADEDSKGRLLVEKVCEGT